MFYVEPTRKNNRFDSQLEEAWSTLFSIIKQWLHKGIQSSRKKYFVQCMTEDEMDKIRFIWSKVKDHGLEEAGTSLCIGSLRAYEQLLKQAEQKQEVLINSHSPEFEVFAKETIQSIDAAVNCYSRKKGFTDLPDLVEPYVQRYIGIEVCPYFVRKAFQEGINNLLEYVLGGLEVDEDVHRIWGKLYRVVEQSIMANIVSF